MKTKVEIIEDITGFDQSEQLESGWVVDFPDVYEAMDIYASQEVKRAASEQQETCKWHINKVHEFIGKPGCQANKQRLFGLGYQYCPFCGKKIERV